MASENTSVECLSIYLNGARLESSISSVLTFKKMTADDGKAGNAFTIKTKDGRVLYYGSMTPVDDTECVFTTFDDKRFGVKYYGIRGTFTNNKGRPLQDSSIELQLDHPQGRIMELTINYLFALGLVPAPIAVNSHPCQVKTNAVPEAEKKASDKK